MSESSEGSMAASGPEPEDDCAVTVCVEAVSDKSG